MSGIGWVAELDQQVPDDLARLLAAVPERFGQSESNAEYIEAARSKETWTVRDDRDRVVGVTLVDRHFAHVAEVYLIVVDRAVHRAGVGTAMLRAIEDDAVRRRVALLQVKTLGGLAFGPALRPHAAVLREVGFSPAGGDRSLG